MAVIYHEQFSARYRGLTVKFSHCEYDDFDRSVRLYVFADPRKLWFEDKINVRDFEAKFIHERAFRVIDRRIALAREAVTTYDFHQAHR